MSKKIHIILLSGGSGTRLWPLSNEARSKQFLKVLRDDTGNHVSMVQRTISQILQATTEIDITIATSDSQKNSIERQVKGEYSLVLEPERRDTAPAIMLATAYLYLEKSVSESDTVVVMPIDTYADQSYYDNIAILNKVVQENISNLVLLGVKPTYPSEKYGYIVSGQESEIAMSVNSFVEKPDEITAKQLMDQGALWNCGVFAFKLGYLLSILKKYTQFDTFTNLREHYRDLPKNSFDYEVVEKETSITVVPYSGTWKDLGTWNTLCEEMVDASAGWVAGLETCEDTHVINELGLPVVALGLNKAIVVATPDGILVSDKNSSTQMKSYVASVAANRPMYEKRFWGEYRVLDSSVYEDGSRSLTKELVIEPGMQISYQKHGSRTEVWTIVSGSGEVVLGDEVLVIGKGSVIHVQQGQKHAIKATEQIHLIEVQFGDMLTEDDIERFGNWWESEIN